MIAEPSHPKGQTSPVTVREAFEALGPMVGHRELSERVRSALRFAKPGTPGSNKSGMGEALFRASGRRASGISLSWLSWARHSFTIVKQEIADSGTIHPDGARYIHPAEAQRIGSFPDDYAITGDRKETLARIGNSVPPLLMRAIARHVRGLPPLPLVPALPYREALAAAWAEHLAPRAPDAPTVISTFAGGGGSSLGYSMAGFREVLLVEWDDNAADTLRLNFPTVPLFHGDIAKLSVEEAFDRAQLQPGALDVLDGSPPCQGFSTAGRRDFGDSRNQLFREYVRLLRGLRPKVFVMENVSGMVKGGMKLIFAEVLQELKASGYAVKARLLNAMFYGVPQSRERMIFIGTRIEQ